MLFPWGLPGSPEKKTGEEGRGQKVMCACMRDACTDYNDEPGTDLELAEVKLILKCALHTKNCTTYLSIKIKAASVAAPGESAL